MDFNMTIGALLGLIATAGVPALVNYVLAQFPAVNENLKKAIQAVSVATLTVLVTSIAAVLPQQWLDAKVLSAAIAVVGMIVAWAGSLFGLKHGEIAFGERLSNATMVAELESCCTDSEFDDEDEDA